MQRTLSILIITSAESTCTKEVRMKYYLKGSKQEISIPICTISKLFLPISHISGTIIIRGITKYGSTLYIGMDEVLAHYACTFEISDLHFYFQ